jgi:AMP deaminase
LDLRHKYLRLSLQGHADNPKDDPSWKIYPPPPPPVWVEDGTQHPATPQANEDGTSNVEREGRKQGLDIGEDFALDECEIPNEDEMEFKLDDQGVYQVYENKKGRL